MKITVTTLAALLGVVWAGRAALDSIHFDNPDSNYAWKVHDPQRPSPPVVVPGKENHLPSSDAIVLFDGTDLSAWKGTKNPDQPAQWKVENGYLEVTPDAGAIQTKESFGSCQLHIEWASPALIKGDSQDRGNSGVYFMDRYEVQILDSYENPTYADGQAGAIYSQNPPLVNACRPPGQWQSYDIIFHAPQFKDGKLLRPADITVFHNGVLVQDGWILTGPTAWKQRPPYSPHPDKLPWSLQDHGNPVRFRNIWIRPLNETYEK